VKQAEAMSTAPTRRPSGHWKIFENVKLGIDEFNLAHGTPGVMPKEKHLKALGCGSLSMAIHGFGGFQIVGARLGYPTSRNPNGHFKDFEVLKSELLIWVEKSGSPGIIPTAEELKLSKPARNDLVTAIIKHSGFKSVAARCGLQMSYEKKADGFYKELSVLACEIYKFVDTNDLAGMMPTPDQLRTSGHGSLVKPIGAHGGFWEVAKALGLTPNRRSPGFWTHESIDAAVKGFLRLTQTEGMMPSDFELREAGRDDLSNAIPRHGGGMAATAERLGLDPRQQAPGFWEGENVIDDALLRFIAEYGTPGMMPTQDDLRKAGRNDLAIAISRFGGGWHVISSRLELETAEEFPKGYWSDFENVKTEIRAYNERRGRPGEMPMKLDLDYSGQFSLCKAIDKFGGYPAVAAKLRLMAGRISLWPRSRDELIIAHELMLFVKIDLDDRKIESAKRTYDADMVIRSLTLVIEYDSHYHHEDKELPDTRKTEALQNAGWNVIRIREDPLPLLQPINIPARKGKYKETCDRVLLRLQTMTNMPIDGLDEYLAQPNLQNKENCERYIHRVLSTRQGNPPEEANDTPDGMRVEQNP
jgi:Protein of unknown function (DUF559)